MTLRRRSLLLAAPALLPFGALMGLPPRRFRAAFTVEYVDADHSPLHRVSWYRRLADGAFIPFSGAAAPPRLFDPVAGARSCRIYRPDDPEARIGSVAVRVGADGRFFSACAPGFS